MVKGLLAGPVMVPSEAVRVAVWATVLLTEMVVEETPALKLTVVGETVTEVPELEKVRIFNPL